MKKELQDKAFSLERLAKEKALSLFYGDKGVGKRTTVFEIIKQHTPVSLHNRIEGSPDILEIKGNESVEEIKEDLSVFNSPAKELSYKWLVINNVEFLSAATINFLLKKLEEPRHYHTFVLTNNIELLPPALISRLHVYFFNTLRKERQIEILKNIPGRQHLISILDKFPFTTMFEIEVFFTYELETLFTDWLLKTNDLADLQDKIGGFFTKIKPLPEYEKNHVITFVLSYILFQAVKTKEYGSLHYMFYLDKIKCKFAPGVLNYQNTEINRENQFKNLLSSIFILKQTLK
jgi:hypothetical protein